MAKPASKCVLHKRAFTVLLFTSYVLSSFVAPVLAQTWVQLGPDSTGETDPSGDINALYFYNDGVYAYFKETLVGASNTTAFTYTVYLDKPAGGVYSQDFKFVYSSATSELQQWNGAGWVYVESITVTTGTSPNSITFKVALSSIANPDIQQDTGVCFVNYVEDHTIDQKWFNLAYGSTEIDAGDIYVSNDATNLYVEIYVDAGWEMSETALRVSKDSLTWGPPGRWPYKHTLDPTVTYDSYTVPLEDIGHGKYGTDPPLGGLEPEDTIYFAVHAVLEPGGETAYAGSWKGYCTTTISGDEACSFISHEDIPELPWPTPLIFTPAVVVALYFVYKGRFKRNG